MQELKQINLIEAIGKKIADVRVGADKYIIKYEDGTFSFFGSWKEWELDCQGYIKIRYDKLIDNLMVFNDGSTYFTESQQMLIELEIIDGQKLIEDAKEHIAKRLKDIEDRELKEYERLKLKFNNK